MRAPNPETALRDLIVRAEDLPLAAVVTGARQS